MTVGSFAASTPITESHDLAHFDCGVAILNDWLKNRAVKNEAAGASRTYVLSDAARVVGYYCLATGGVDRAHAPGPMSRNMPHPVPVVVLGRLAIDRDYQHQGLGRALLRDAILRSVRVAEIAGAVALLVHAISEEARRFYLSNGFAALPSQPMTLYLMMRTIDPPDAMRL